MLSFLLIGSVLLLAAMSPGPDFVVVTKNATLHSRRAGLWTALGVGAGVLVHATYSLAGLGFVVEHSLLAFSIIKWAGALYLAYLGVSLLISKSSATAEEVIAGPRALSGQRAFIEGLGTNLLNPKAVLFFVGVFAQVISIDASILLKIAYVLEAGVIVGGWFLALALFLNIPKCKAALRYALRPVERLMGVLLLGFAARLALERS